jgi:site-specific recombinase XerD
MAARSRQDVLRASFATHVLRQGTPIHVVNELMGHRDIPTTASYLALVAEDRR